MISVKPETSSESAKRGANAESDAQAVAPEDRRDSLKIRVASLPLSPGVYLYRDAKGILLYVGKAQNLRARVGSYFSGSDTRYQVPRLVERIADIEVLVTPTGKDALLLENELIKQHKPPFNVRLRDDKQYLALRLDLREPWPRLTTVRRFKKDGAQYFGPYTSSKSLREALHNLRRIFPLRTCTDPTFRDYARRGRPCLEYEMKRCPAPCCDRIESEPYAELVNSTVLFLRGKNDELVEECRTEMRRAAESQRFEEAAVFRDRLAAIEATVARQQIVAAHHEDRDVFGLAREGSEVQVQVLHVRDGRVVGAADYAFSDVRIDDGEVLSSFLAQFYAEEAARLVPRKLLLPAALPDDDAVGSFLDGRAEGRVVRVIPQRGEHRKLLIMAEDNARLRLRERMHAQASLLATCEELQARLALPTLPRHIECYDVSNLMGTYAVASRVVFREGQPEKKDYRHYRIREAKGGDDLACMREVLTRRFERIETEPLPDLLMVDGGKGQLGVATALLADRGLALSALGLAKEVDVDSPSPRVKRGGGLKAERIFLPKRKDALTLPPSSQGLLLLQRIRDESHRFAIEFQRSLRRKANLLSILEEIPGIGPGKRTALLRELGSLRAVREADRAGLSGVSGISAADAQAIRSFFDALDGKGEALESTAQDAALGVALPSSEGGEDPMQ